MTILCRVSLLTLLFHLAASITFGQVKKSEGYLIGDAVYVAETRGAYGKPATSVIIEPKGNGKRYQILANDFGLYGINLPVGKFKLVTVYSTEGRILKLSSSQMKGFTIRKNSNTRFDIELLNE